MSRSRLVICGGGYAGVTLAHLLHRRRLTDLLDVTLVSPDPYQVCLTELPEVVRGLSADHFSLTYGDLFRGTGVRVIEGTVERGDFAGKEVVLSGGDRLSYDYLVIAMGNQPALPPIPGLATFGFMLWSRRDAERLSSHLEAAFRQAGKADDPAPWTGVVVGGGGFTGVEITGELMERCNALGPG